MSENQLVKKNLFKVKKVVFTEKGRYGGYSEGDAFVGVVIPCFDNTYNRFEENRISLLTLEGEKLNFRVESIGFETTRIMDKNVKEKLDKIVEFSKEVHKSQIEKVKFYEDFKKKEQKLKDKTKKQSDSMEKLVNQLKKAQGFLTTEETIKAINKFLPEELYQDTWSKEFYKCSLSKDKQLIIRFGKNMITYAQIENDIELGRWCEPEQYDFVYEEYDRTLHTSNLDNSEDFEKLKKKYFKSFKESVLEKANVSMRYSAGVGDKNTLIIGQDFVCDLGIELKKDNLKEITKRLKSLLKFA